MKVGVYGLGRFGSFWATILSSRFDVYGFNRTPLREPPRGVRMVPEDELLSCDALFLCVSISSLEGVLGSIAPRIRHGALVMDTCSVKVAPAKLMESLLPAGVDIMATHPMFGPDSAAGPSGIHDLPMVVAPIRGDGSSAESWIGIFSAMGLRGVRMSPDKHDREAAYTQGITHFIGRVLGELSLSPSQIATKGYVKLLEIVEQTCNDPLQLFLDLQRYNPYTWKMREELSASVRRVLESISPGPESP